MTTERQTANARWREWYRENRPGYNRKRRARYAQDKNYRQQARKRTRDYKRRKLGRLGNGQVLRELNGDQVVCVRVGYLAEETGVSAAIISKLHRRGVFPETLFPGRRLYTPVQVRLLVRFLREWAVLESNAEREALIRVWQPKLAEQWSNV